jgi:hypothetical protein
VKYRALLSATVALLVPLGQASAENYDLTNCGSSTVTTIWASQELTIIGLDTKGIGRNNLANKAFDNLTYQCVSVVSIAGAERKGMGYCKFMEPDGDFIVGEQLFDTSGGGKWKFLHGTGKWKGVTGAGEFMPLTSGKPIVPGTSQGCGKATGTYEVSK